MDPIQITPSLLSANFACLGEEVKAMANAGADGFHLDIMDGHYVPNISFGPGVIHALRPLTNLPFHVHLMIKPVDHLLKAFCDAGADRIYIHADAEIHYHRTLQTIRGLGKQSGLVLNPGQSPNMFKHAFDMVDSILVMTVNPGFGGQKFLSSQLAVVEEAKQMETAMSLGVDGGVTAETAPLARQSGADILIAGTSAFQGGPEKYVKNIRQLRGCR